MLNKVRKHIWFVYATKEKALEQEGPYAWIAYTNESEQWAKGWIEYKNTKYASNIIGLLLPGNAFTILASLQRTQPMWTDAIIHVLSDSGLNGWIIQPHSQEGGWSSSCFEEMEEGTTCDKL